MPRTAFDPKARNNLAGEAASPSIGNPPEDLAERIARGDIRFPSDLSAERQVELALAVQRIRRDRLLRLIASAIAQDIAAGASHGGVFHAS